MKYKVGDKVRIRPDLKIGKTYISLWRLAIHAHKFLGQTGHISSVTDDELYMLDFTGGLEWPEEALELVKITINDLKTGMFGITNIGNKFMILNDVMVFQKGTWDDIHNWRNDFVHVDGGEKIMEIYDGVNCFGILDSPERENFQVVYKREHNAPAKMTLSQVKERLGFNFQLVED